MASRASGELSGGFQWAFNASGELSWAFNASGELCNPLKPQGTYWEPPEEAISTPGKRPGSFQHLWEPPGGLSRSFQHTWRAFRELSAHLGGFQDLLQALKRCGSPPWSSIGLRIYLRYILEHRVVARKRWGGLQCFPKLHS